MPWDPLESWPNERRWIWATIAFWVVILRGPAFIEDLQARPPGELVPDFFQEYASARGWLEGNVVYADYAGSVQGYLGIQLDDRRSHVTVNAHPPASVLLALPLAKLDFPKAFLAWNIVSLAALAVSLWIVQWQLKIPVSASSLAPLVALLFLCYPLWEHCRLGQLTLILLLLVTGAWAAERSGRPLLAGCLLGAATAVKLFPGFLLVYYALRGRWRVVSAAFLTIAALLCLSTAILGIEAHRTYFTSVLPSIQWFRVGWDNNSLWGFWSRLFDPAPEHVRDRALTEPLFYSPPLATMLSLVSSAAITAALAWAVRRDADGRKSDLTFALAVVAMLLVSPICWDHYLLLLLVPLAVVWIELPATWLARTLFLVIIAAFWLGYPLVWTAFDLNGRTATWGESAGVLSYQFYALLALVGLIVMELRQEGRPPFGSARDALGVGAVVLLCLWSHVILSIWRGYGLFFFIGGDFGIYRSIAKATLAVGSRAMYDLDLVAPFARELMSYYGPDAHGLNLGPGPYPAVYILPFIALTACSPPLGYAIWTCLGLALVCAVARGAASPSPRSWSAALAGIVYFPVVSALIYGQLTMLFVYGFYRAYHDLRKGQDFRGGLWCGALYLKPQYVAFPLLVFLLKKRWRAAGGLLLAGLVVLLASLAIVGPQGLVAQYRTLQSMSGFRDVDPIIGPTWMINWRGLLTNMLPEDVADRTGQLLTLGLSIATLGVLPLVWRGRWDPRGDRFPIAMLATVIVMMMASYHNHIHSAALLIVPGIEVAAQRGSSRILKALLLAGLYLPPVLFFATASMISVVWLFIALMLAGLAVIVWREVEEIVGLQEDQTWEAVQLPPSAV